VHLVGLAIETDHHTCSLPLPSSNLFSHPVDKSTS